MAKDASGRDERCSADFADRVAALDIIESWIADHTGHADPMVWSTPVEAAFRRKCFAELGFVLTLSEAMGDVPRTGRESRLGSVKASLLDQVDDALISLAHRSPDRASIFAFPIAFAAKAGTLNPGQARRVRDLLSSRFAWGIERLPYRYLDMAAACAMAGGEPPIAVDAMIQTSSLALPPDPFTAPKDALYALTHAVFFTFLLKGCPLEADPDLAFSIHGSMRRALADNDLDLGLELVIAARLCGLGGYPAEDCLVDQVTALILDSGVIRASFSSASEPFARVCPNDAAWAESVHIMQVAALAVRANLVMPPQRKKGRYSGAEMEREIGALVLDIYRYDLKRAADRLVSLEACDVDQGQREFLDRARQQILATARPDGGYGHFGDDRRAFALAYPGEDFIASRAVPTDVACRTAMGLNPSGR